jgi:putative ABC transport system permease protein
MRSAEKSRDIHIIPWLDSLRSDAVFGWQQLMKRKVTSAAAILSLALAIGACTSAFRLIDALLLRPLPVSDPERLFSLYREGIGFDGKPQTVDAWAYPSFRRMRAAVRDQAELLAICYAERMDISYKSDHEMEKPYLQYVSGYVQLLRTAAGIGSPVHRKGLARQASFGDALPEPGWTICPSRRPCRERARYQNG